MHRECQGRQSRPTIAGFPLQGPEKRPLSEPPIWLAERVGLCGTSLCRTPSAGSAGLRGRAPTRASKFAPGKFVEPVASNLPSAQPAIKKAPFGAFFMAGGEGGIRTHGTPKRTTDFESAPFDHSGTSPHGRQIIPSLSRAFHFFYAGGASRLSANPATRRLSAER